ncbi:MAG TPA: hypothetical protein VKB96_06440 [Gammaproteobacteria bacterium]|nr:hypothetical protein [Gammaproteobacteria bacterium]
MPFARKAIRKVRARKHREYLARCRRMIRSSARLAPALVSVDPVVQRVWAELHYRATRDGLCFSNEINQPELERRTAGAESERAHRDDLCLRQPYER